MALYTGLRGGSHGVSAEGCPGVEVSYCKDPSWELPSAREGTVDSRLSGQQRRRDQHRRSVRWGLWAG